ncbi:MAG: phosphatase PAP2 family protein [Anaplasmataceae bacterium]|nr:phosphatase PAP2 family protein [Anaplasmataceae bacterium]
MKKKFALTPEGLLYLLVVLLGTIVAVFRSRFREGDDLGQYVAYYAGLLFGPVVEALLGYAGAIALFLFIAFGIGVVYSGLKKHHPLYSLSLVFGRVARRWWRERFFLFLRVGVPVILVFFFGGLIMSYLNMFNSVRLMDATVAEWDRFLLGDYPFLSIYEVQYSSFLVWAIVQSFSYLPFAFFALFFLVLAIRPEVFIRMAVTFSMALVFSIPLWNAFPVLSPHDRYLDNVYQLPLTEDIQERLRQFSPQPEIREYLGAAREEKTKRLQTYYPTSTLPSAHVQWAVFLIYFSYLIDRRWLWFTVPVGVLSSIGTFFLAQHYVVDVPAGVLVAVVMIWIVNKLFNGASNSYKRSEF